MASNRRIQAGRLGIGHVLVDLDSDQRFKVLGVSRTGKQVTVDVEVDGTPTPLPLNADEYVLVVER